MPKPCIVVVESVNPDVTRETLAAVAEHTAGEYDLRVVAERADGWARCIGHETIIMEAGHVPQTLRWTHILRVQSRAGHTLLSLLPPFAGVAWTFAHAQEVVTTSDLARFSAATLYLPAEVTAVLGGWNDYGHPVLDMADYVVRAKLLGWHWGYSLRVRQRTVVPESMLTPAVAETDAWRRFQSNVAAYEAGERDIHVARQGASVEKIVP